MPFSVCGLCRLHENLLKCVNQAAIMEEEEQQRSQRYSPSLKGDYDVEGTKDRKHVHFLFFFALKHTEKYSKMRMDICLN